MIDGAIATIYVSDMDRAVDFYSRVLELRLAGRYGDEWASLDAGNGMSIGLHPRSRNHPPPGTSGSITVGFNVTDPIEHVMDRLRSAGVAFRGALQGDPNAPIRIAFFGDPDGNDLYLYQTSY